MVEIITDLKEGDQEWVVASASALRIGSILNLVDGDKVAHKHHIAIPIHKSFKHTNSITREEKMTDREIYIDVFKGQITNLEQILAHTLHTDVLFIIENRPIKHLVYYGACRYGNYNGKLPGAFSWGLPVIANKYPAYTSNEFCTLSGNDGTGIPIYIMDTGVNQHNTFQNRVFRDFDYFGTGAWDSYSIQHGTHVAGIAASSIYGVAPNVQIHAIRVLDSTGSGSLASLVAGLLYIQYNGSPGVINLSLGMLGGYSSTIASVMTNMMASNFIFSVAAGNSDVDASIEFPANVPGVLCVGAFDISKVKASFSNYGPTVNIWAPGVDIISTFGNGTGTEILSGTSMATPFVTGIAALFMQLNPTWTSTDIIGYLMYVSRKNVIQGLDRDDEKKRHVQENNQQLYYVQDSGFVPGQPAPPPPGNEGESVVVSILFMVIVHGVLFYLVY